MRGKQFTHGLFIIFLIAVLLVGTASTLLAGNSQEAPDAPKHINLTWTGDSRTTQTITWETIDCQSNGQIEYAEKAAGIFSKALQVDAQTELVSTSSGDVDIHSVMLTNLKPGTSYFYRVGNGSKWSERRSFTTAAEGISKFQFLVFSDSQSDCYDLWQAVLKKAHEANPNAAFLTVVGDLVDVGTDYGQWDAWFNAAEAVITTIPVMPVTGNHEYYTPIWGERSRPEMFTAQVKLPGNGPEGLKGHVYSFDYGNTHFVMLDSQDREAAQFMPDMLSRQKAWLEKDLAATDKKWKVVFLHKPLYPSKAARDNNTIRSALVPIFDRYHVDVVFSGHEHVYARTYPLCDGAIVDSAAIGTIYITAGRSGTKVHHGLSANNWHEAFYSPEDEPIYLVVEVADNDLSVKAFKQNGSQIDAVRIDKN